MDYKSIGKRIKEKRLKKSWSQEQLGERVNLSAVYIGMIERGEKIPRLETFIRIANCLNASSDEILADVLNEGYKVRSTRYAEEISRLNERERNRLYQIIEAYLEN